MCLLLGIKFWNRIVKNDDCLDFFLPKLSIMHCAHLLLNDLQGYIETKWDARSSYRDVYMMTIYVLTSYIKILLF